MSWSKVFGSLVLLALAACTEHASRSSVEERSPIATDPAVVALDGDVAELKAPPLRAEVALDCPAQSTAPVSRMHRGHAGDAAQVERILHAYRCRHPELTRLVEIGRSHLGRPLLALFIGRDLDGERDRPTMLLNGGHHGSEFLSTLFVADAIGTLLEDEGPEMQRILDELVVVAVPLVNPDGSHLTTKLGLVGRKNGRDVNGDGRRGYDEGVDLNRNYPFRWGALGENGSRSLGRSQYYRGPAPASEPETRAMMQLAAGERFAAAISYHTGTIGILPPYTIPGVRAPEPNVAWGIAQELAAKVKKHPEGRFPVRKNLYPVDGTDQDWLFHTFGTMALLVEGAGHYAHQSPVRRVTVAAVRHSWRALFARFLDGPAVTGRVTDARGMPVEAEVSIDEISLSEGERWTSRCRDGRFSRFLPKRGTYTLRVRGDHEPEVVRTVEVEGLERVDIRLPIVVSADDRCSESR